MNRECNRCNRCAARTRNGRRCLHKPTNGSEFCNQHLPKNISSRKIFCEEKEKKDEKLQEKNVAKKSYEKPESCPVCFEDFDEVTKPIEPCGHWVHMECIVKWGEGICPVCRKKVNMNKKNVAESRKNRKKYRHHNDPTESDEAIVQVIGNEEFGAERAMLRDETNNIFGSGLGQLIVENPGAIAAFLREHNILP
jgi:hypothetical protein